MLAVDLVRPGGHVADIVVPGKGAGSFGASRFITHHFGFDAFDKAYDTFFRAGDTGAEQGRPHPLWNLPCHWQLLDGILATRRTHTWGRPLETGTLPQKDTAPA